MTAYYSYIVLKALFHCQCFQPVARWGPSKTPSWEPSPSLLLLSLTMSVGAMASLLPPTLSKSWDVSRYSRPSLTPDSANMWTSPEGNTVWPSVSSFVRGSDHFVYPALPCYHISLRSLCRTAFYCSTAQPQTTACGLTILISPANFTTKVQKVPPRAEKDVLFWTIALN